MASAPEAHENIPSSRRRIPFRHVWVQRQPKPRIAKNIDISYLPLRVTLDSDDVSKTSHYQRRSSHGETDLEGRLSTPWRGSWREHREAQDRQWEEEHSRRSSSLSKISSMQRAAKSPSLSDQSSNASMSSEAILRRRFVPRMPQHRSDAQVGIRSEDVLTHMRVPNDQYGSPRRVMSPIPEGSVWDTSPRRAKQRDVEVDSISLQPWKQPLPEPPPGTDHVVVKETFVYRPKKNTSIHDANVSEKVEKIVERRHKTGNEMSKSQARDEAAKYFQRDWQHGHDRTDEVVSSESDTSRHNPMPEPTKDRKRHHRSPSNRHAKTTSEVRSGSATSLANRSGRQMQARNNGSKHRDSTQSGTESTIDEILLGSKRSRHVSFDDPSECSWAQTTRRARATEPKSPYIDYDHCWDAGGGADGFEETGEAPRHESWE